MSATNPAMKNASPTNVLERLARLKRIAAQHGFEVRGELLGPDSAGRDGLSGDSLGGGSTWCEIRGKRILFLDETQTAAEQAASIREILELTAHIRPQSGREFNNSLGGSPVDGAIQIQRAA